MKVVEWLDHYVFEIENFLQPEECDSFIEDSLKQGYEPTTIETRGGAMRVERIRNNDRLTVDDKNLADGFWRPLKPFLPDVFGGREPIGLNERFRYYRYTLNQLFDWHFDGFYERENGECSQYTFMVYLNDDFIGGTTSFCDVKCKLVFDEFVVTPQKGSALLFFHRIPHRGDPVIEGTKFVLRSDVMYSKPL